MFGCPGRVPVCFVALGGIAVLTTVGPVVAHCILRLFYGFVPLLFLLLNIKNVPGRGTDMADANVAKTAVDSAIPRPARTTSNTGARSTTTTSAAVVFTGSRMYFFVSVGSLAVATATGWAWCLTAKKLQSPSRRSLRRIRWWRCASARRASR